MTPVWAMHDGDRGVVAEGGVGTRGAGRSKFFRYEVHCWRGGSIADIAQAVASPTRPTSDEATCRRLLTLLRSVPAGGGIRPCRRSAAMPGGDRNSRVTSEALGRRGRIRRLELREEGKFPVATCLAESSCPRGRCPRPVPLARSPRRADEPATSGERRGLMTAGILGP